MEKALSEYISSLEELSSELSQMHKIVTIFKDKCDVAKVVGTTVSTGGTLLAIGSALFAIPTGGLSLLVTGSAIATTIVGAATNGVTDAINISETKDFMQKAEKILTRGKDASDKLAIHWEHLRLQFDGYKQQGIPQDEAALRAVLKTIARLPAMTRLPKVVANVCVKKIESQLLSLSLQVERLAAKSILKHGTTTTSKMLAKNTATLLGGVAKGTFIGLNVALQVNDIFDLFNEIDADHPAATAIRMIISQLTGKIREAKKLREEFNAVKSAYQQATKAEARAAQTHSRPTENNKDRGNTNKTTQDEVACDRGDGADDEDPKRTPNRRTCEYQISEARVEELIRLLQELVRELQGLTGAGSISPQRLQSLLDRFIKILQRMYIAGFKCRINRRTRDLSLSITINGRQIVYEFSREEFHLCDLDPSNMRTVFSAVHISESSEHVICNEAGAVYYIRAVDDEYDNVRYVGITSRRTHARVCMEHLRAIARFSQLWANKEEISVSDLDFLENISYFYREAGMAASALGLYEVDQLADLLEVFCMPLQSEEYAELRFWEIIWQWFFSTRFEDGGSNER